MAERGGTHRVCLFLLWARYFLVIISLDPQKGALPHLSEEETEADR